MTLDSLGNYISRKIMIDDISFIAEKVGLKISIEIRDLIDKLRDNKCNSTCKNIFDGKLTFTVGVSKRFECKKD